MLSFFKKKKIPANNQVVTESQYPAIVKEIHNEFFTAGDEILNEATCLLKELEQKDLAKGKRLASLGFSKTREAVVAIETENKLATTKEIADLVVYYRLNYPNNKFITDEQVKSICEKYGLVCGDTTMYKGFVPESKLSIIEKFNCNKNDYKVLIQTNAFGAISYDELLTHFTEPFCKKYQNDKSREVRGVKSSMKICAPLKDMDIPSTHKLNGHKVEHIPDPVVLQPVNGGYLVVACWGDEASDEIIVKQTMN